MADATQGFTLLLGVSLRNSRILSSHLVRKVTIKMGKEHAMITSPILYFGAPSSGSFDRYPIIRTLPSGPTVNLASGSASP